MEKMRERLEELNPWWNKKYSDASIPREKYFRLLRELLDRKDVIILTGIRRVGKTTILKSMIQYLIDQNVDPKHILFLSLDLLYFKDYNIQDIVLEYKKIHQIEHGTKVYLFLDEVTYKPHFNQELKNLYDMENYKVFASSSSAKVLKDNKAYLTGRARYIEIEPLDFKEFLLFNKKNIRAESHILESLFEQYMRYGGMPEYVLHKDETYLSELIELIINKDIIAEHNIRNKRVVFDLYRLLCERVGEQISYNNISKILNVDNETISRHIEYFLDTFLFSLIEVKHKLNVQITSKKKLYCCDVGLRNIITGFRDKGAIYENLVYNKIKKNSKRINFLYRNGVEIDFVTDDSLIEAKYNQNMTEKQKELFDSLNAKNKVLANGVSFFID